MDLFEFDFFRDWELEQQCHFEPDRSALKKREWERRTQEVQQDDDLFSTGFNLFGEPYKTNKGDALANRVQNTLGNYDEMKELLTSHSNQSHLVGIPKNSVPQTPGPERTPADQAGFFQPEAQRGGGRAGSAGGSLHATSTSSASMPPPPSSSSSSSSSSTSSSGGLLQGNQSSKKSRSSEGSRGGHGSTSAQGQGLGLGGCRGKPQVQDSHNQRHEDLFSIPADSLIGTKADSSPASSSSSSSLPRRHAPPTKPGSSSLVLEHLKSSPFEPEAGSHISSSPLASTSLLATPSGLTTPTASGLTTPTFPGALPVKPSAPLQKPTAYVRPMDGQDQVPNDSPELKPPLEVGDAYSNPAFGSSTASSKNKLPKLTLTQTGEVSLSTDSSCVEEILREMTHSWPPPLTAINTPGKAELTKFPIPSKESQHLPSGYGGGQKRCNVPSNKPATKSVPQKSMLEDDLKISSDEEDNEQQVSDKTKPRTTTLSLPVAASRSADQGHSSGASGSSSESESSSESDSDSESSSSDSECNGASRTATPEPEPPSTNKWQLDKWLNKVTPHNKSLVTPQPESHVPLISSQPTHTHNLASESTAPGVKNKPGNPPLSQALPDPKDPRGLLSPGRDKAKPKAGQRAPEGQRSKGKLPGGAGAEPAAPRRSTGKKQPRKVERSSSLDDQQQHHPPWPRPSHTSLPTNPPREKDPPPPPLPLETPRPRTKTPSGKTAPRKEPRNTSTISTPTLPAPAPPAPPPPAPPAPPVDKKKHRGPSKIVPKSKEFIETESSSSSECHSDPEDPGKVQLPAGPAPSTTQGSLGSSGGLKPKDCIPLGSNNLSVSSLGSSSSTSIPDPGGVGDLEDPDPLFSPTPLGQTHLLSPLRDLEHIKSLWVKIELSFLSRIPGQEAARNPTPPPPPAAVHAVSAKMAETRVIGAKHRRQSPSSSTPVQKTPSKSKRKHKSDHCEAVNGSKKLRLEADSLLLPPCISPIHNHKSAGTKDSLRRQSRKEKLLPPLLSPLSDEPPRPRRPSECSSSFGQDGGPSGPITSTLPALGLSLPPSSSSSSSTSSSSSHKHRRGDGKAFSHSKTSSEDDTHGKPCGGFHGNGQSDSDVWSNPSSMSMEHAEPRRPRLTFNSTVHSADHYMQEAKKLKHKADALMEKFGKAVNYADGALSFIECGNAMERDPLEAKSPYTMYSETVELIRYAMRLKNFTSHSATVAEKKLAVLCNRCLSLLYLRMFKLKKDHAVKYSRSLMEYFKNSSKSSQAPSPWGANGKSTGTPSPLSLSPSPVSSVCSSGGGASGQTGSAPSGSVAIPQRIHHMAASHVNITNNILRSYEHWDTAERLAAESHEFFEELDSVLEPLSQLSSMTDLVRYIRQGLHWLRIEAHLL